MTATAIRNIGDTDVIARELDGADDVTYLDLDGDGVPDAVRRRMVTDLYSQGAGHCLHVVETVEAVDADGSTRLLSLDERFEPVHSAAIA